MVDSRAGVTVVAKCLFANRLGMGVLTCECKVLTTVNLREYQQVHSLQRRDVHFLAPLILCKSQRKGEVERQENNINDGLMCDEDYSAART